MKKALLVIDMQNFCVGVHRSDFFNYNNEELINSVNKVIDANTDNTVIYIKNILKRNVVNKFAPFDAYEGTPEVELVEGLHIVALVLLRPQLKCERSLLEIIYCLKILFTYTVKPEVSVVKRCLLT